MTPSRAPSMTCDGVGTVCMKMVDTMTNGMRLTSAASALPPRQNKTHKPLYRLYPEDVNATRLHGSLLRQGDLQRTA